MAYLFIEIRERKLLNTHTLDRETAKAEKATFVSVSNLMSTWFLWPSTIQEIERLMIYFSYMNAIFYVNSLGPNRDKVEDDQYTMVQLQNWGTSNSASVNLW